eukprot:7983_1
MIESEPADTTPPPFWKDLHRDHVVRTSTETDTIEYVWTSYLRINGVYWGLSAMSLLGYDVKKDMAVPGSEIADWIMSCQCQGGGFSASPGHDPHLLCTLSALQSLVLLGELGRVMDCALGAEVSGYVARLQQPDGSFWGDQWGEVDTRFSYCALASLSILNRLHDIDTNKASEFVATCKNFDGGFGCVPGAESHAGQVFTCVGALSIAGRLDLVDDALLGWWLAERQCDSGGLNGRPEKQADVCYSWWILSALCILGKMDWLNGDKLARFILDCQDAECGGIAERPGHVSDVFHTFFGVAGLSLLGKLRTEDGYAKIDPVYALPVTIVQDLQLKRQILPPSSPLNLFSEVE